MTNVSTMTLSHCEVCVLLPHNTLCVKSFLQSVSQDRKHSSLSQILKWWTLLSLGCCVDVGAYTTEQSNAMGKRIILLLHHAWLCISLVSRAETQSTNNFCLRNSPLIHQASSWVFDKVRGLKGEKERERDQSALREDLGQFYRFTPTWNTQKHKIWEIPVKRKIVPTIRIS